MMKRLVKTGLCSVAIIIGIVVSNYSDELRTSKAGLEIIGNSESCVRVSYYCPANVLTAMIGATGDGVEIDKIYTDHEIAERWVSDIKQAEQCVNLYANGEKLPQSVFDATVSITFNCGCGNMKKSTMFKYLNNGDYYRACNELPRWNKAGGQVLKGLVIRREKERELCLNL